MSEPTRPEIENAVARIEYFYRYDRPGPIERPTCVDLEGYGWVGRYWALYLGGMPHEQAIQAVEKGMREAVNPPPPPTTKPIKGQLRISGLSYVDDDGLVLPLLCHAGELFSAWTRRPDDVKRQLDAIRQADYHGIRFWDVLGYYSQGWGGKEVTPISFKNDLAARSAVGPRRLYGSRYAPMVTVAASRGVTYTTVPATPNYYEQLHAFLSAVKERALVVHHSRGDLNSWAKPDILTHCKKVGEVQRAVGLTVIAINEACNEAELNIGDWSTTFLDQMIAAINNPSVLKALSDVSQNEDANTLVRYARDNVYVHGYRGGDADPVGQIRHIHSLRYDGAVKIANKVGDQGEPGGPGMSGPSLRRTDTLVLCAMQAWCCRQAWTHGAENGVFWNGPIGGPGFLEVPKSRYWLPPDVMTYPEAFHGGTTWRGRRILVAEYPDGRLRADHRLRDRDFTITVHAKPGQQWALPVERAFVGHVVDPINGPGNEQTWNGGTFEFDGRDRTGVVVVGRLL